VKNIIEWFERSTIMNYDYLLIAQCEVLVEYANGVMSKYEKYLHSESALDCIRKMYKDLCSYNTKIILCDSQSEFDTLYRNVKEYEWIIENVLSDDYAEVSV
jgi:deoxyribodipyrimidine photolyase-like uncharacterized protein